MELVLDSIEHAYGFTMRVWSLREEIRVGASFLLGEHIRMRLLNLVHNVFRLTMRDSLVKSM